MTSVGTRVDTMLERDEGAGEFGSLDMTGKCAASQWLDFGEDLAEHSLVYPK